MKTPTANLKTWFWINLKIGCLSFGSVARTMLFFEEVVENRNWLSRDEFQQIMTVSQILPGPNLVNISSYLGNHLAGRLAAVCGVIALCIPGAMMTILVAIFVPLNNPDVQEVFRGFAIGAFLLMGGFLWNLARGIPSSEKPGVKTSTKKLAARLILIFIVTTLGFLGTPIPWLVFGGIAICLALEFSL